MNMKISFINRTVLHLIVRAYLNDNLPRNWIVRASEDNVMLKWPPHSPDLTPCDFSLGICEDLGLCPHLPENENELKQRITIALEIVAQDMLHRV